MPNNESQAVHLVQRPMVQAVINPIIVLTHPSPVKLSLLAFIADVDYFLTTGYHLIAPDHFICGSHGPVLVDLADNEQIADLSPMDPITLPWIDDFPDHDLKSDQLDLVIRVAQHYGHYSESELLAIIKDHDSTDQFDHPTAQPVQF